MIESADALGTQLAGEATLAPVAPIPAIFWDAGNGFVSPSALHRCTEILNECLADFNSFIEQHTKYLVGLGERFRAREWASFWAIPLSNKGDFYLYFNAVDTKPTKICIAKTEDYLFE